MTDKEPKPEDYPEQVNAYIRARQRWLATQLPLPLEPIPADLEHLFTSESLEAARKQRGSKG